MKLYKWRDFFPNGHDFAATLKIATNSAELGPVHVSQVIQFWPGCWSAAACAGANIAVTHFQPGIEKTQHSNNTTKPTRTAIIIYLTQVPTEGGDGGGAMVDLGASAFGGANAAGFCKGTSVGLGAITNSSCASGATTTEGFWHTGLCRIRHHHNCRLCTRHFD